MIALVQRIRHAKVVVGGETAGEAQRGILALIGVEKEDSPKQADRLLERLLGYRIFPDENDRMNLSLSQIDGDLLLVPQFTLAADTQKGMRPSFTSAAEPQRGKQLFAYLLDIACKVYPHVSAGRFGADMQVELVNDGPVTFWLQSN